MSNFNVGDKVRLKTKEELIELDGFLSNKLGVLSFDSIIIVPEMCKYLGKEVTIKSIGYSFGNIITFYIEDDNGMWMWDEMFFERIEK